MQNTSNEWQNAVGRSLAMKLNPSKHDVLIDPANFPPNYANGCHPDDGKFLEHPINPEYTIFETSYSSPFLKDFFSGTAEQANSVYSGVLHR